MSSTAHIMHTTMVPCLDMPWGMTCEMPWGCQVRRLQGAMAVLQGDMEAYPMPTMFPFTCTLLSDPTAVLQHLLRVTTLPSLNREEC